MNASDTAANVQRLVQDLGAAFQLRASYAPGHPQVTTAVDRVLEDLEAFHGDGAAAEVSILLLEGQLLVDRIPLPVDAAWGRGLVRSFGRHGIRGMTLARGLDRAELDAFLDACLGPGGPAPSTHIRLGQAGFAADLPEGIGSPSDAAAPASDEEPAPALLDELQGARDDFREIAGGAASRVERLRGLVASLARGAGPASRDALRAAAAGVDDRELLHGLAVAVSTLRIARALRLEGRALEEVVLAGLLHDVGHLAGPGPEEDPGLTQALHAIRGAARLAAIEGIPDLVVRAVHEHHLRVDGAPNPAILGVGSRRRPGAAARVVAVADAWETLRSRAGLSSSDALLALRRRAGTFLDPALVEVLAAVVGEAPARPVPGP